MTGYFFDFAFVFCLDFMEGTVFAQRHIGYVFFRLWIH